jgi:dCMP deaminase
MDDLVKNLSELLLYLQSNKENVRLDWNKYFMSIAIIGSIRSPCERLKVGCVLVKNNRLVSMGYNGFLPGAKHVSRVRNSHEQSTIHAEQNAISDAASRGVSLFGCIAYITHYPCINCFKILAAAGIQEIIYLNDYNKDELVEEMLRDREEMAYPITIERLVDYRCR